jgi:hypothetical protein
VSQTRTSPLGRTVGRQVKQVSLLRGSVQSKSSGNCESYPRHHTTASPHILLSCAAECHHVLRQAYHSSSWRLFPDRNRIISPSYISVEMLPAYISRSGSENPPHSVCSGRITTSSSFVVTTWIFPLCSFLRDYPSSIAPFCRTKFMNKTRGNIYA